MRKYFILPLLLVLAVGLSAPLAFAQTTGTVKGVCKDIEGKPIVQAEVEWVRDRIRPHLQAQNQQQRRVLLARHRSRQVQRQAQQRRQGTLSLQRRLGRPGRNGAGLRSEERADGRSPGPGIDAGASCKAKEALAKAESENKTVGTLNDKLKAANAASDAGDFETAIATLNEANQIDATRDLIWFKLGDAYRMSAPKQTDPAEKQKRYEMAATDYQKAIDLRSASETAQKIPTIT